MNTSKFKVGDTVVRVKKDFQHIKVGHVGIVSQVGSFSVRLDNDPLQNVLEPDYFELYEEPRKFSGKFRIENEEHSRKVQEYLFSIGCKWVKYKDTVVRSLSTPYLYAIDSVIYNGYYEETFAEELSQEYTLKETTTYSVEAVPTPIPKIETIEILGKHYSKEDVEKAFSKLQEIEK